MPSLRLLHFVPLIVVRFLHLVVVYLVHLLIVECLQVKALERDIRKQVLKSAELKFEAQIQAKANSSKAILGSSLALPKSTAQAVTLLRAVKRSSSSRETSRETKFLARTSDPNSQHSSAKSKASWYMVDSSKLEAAAKAEDRARQEKFHQELLKVRKDANMAARKSQKELAREHLLYKKRAKQTATTDAGGPHSPHRSHSGRGQPGHGAKESHEAAEERMVRSHMAHVRHARTHPAVKGSERGSPADTN